MSQRFSLFRLFSFILSFSFVFVLSNKWVLKLAEHTMFAYRVLHYKCNAPQRNYTIQMASIDVLVVLCMLVLFSFLSSKDHRNGVLLHTNTITRINESINFIWSETRKLSLCCTVCRFRFDEGWSANRTKSNKCKRQRRR